MDIIERAKAALETIALGLPWGVEAGEIEHYHFHYDPADSWYDVDGRNGGWKAHCEDLATANFIAAAPDLVRELCGELAASRALLSATRAQLSDSIADFCALRDVLPREQVKQILAERRPSTG